MLGLPVDASPWAIFEELGRRGFSIEITRGREMPLRATATKQEHGTGQIHAVEASTSAELALQLVESIATLPAPTPEPTELQPAGHS